MLWNEKLLQRVYYMRTEENKTYREIISSLGMSDVTVEQLRSALRRWRKNRTPTTRIKTYGSYSIAKFAGDSILGMGDLHCPYFNKSFFMEAVRVARERNVDSVAIVGDLFDFASLSTYPKNEYQEDLTTEFNSVRWVLKYLSSAGFKNIIICNGNHDERLAKKINANFTLENLIYAALLGTQLDSNLYTVEQDYFFVNERWVFGHPQQYKRTPGELAYNLSGKYRQNVAIWHDHIQGVVSDSQFIGISVGGMFDMTQQDADQQGRQTRFYYKERRLNTYPYSANGFIIIEGERPLLYNQDAVLHPLFNGGTL